MRSCDLAILRSGEFPKFISGNLNRAKMGTIKNFEDLDLWKNAREMVNLIYSDFGKCRDLTFRGQITGAGISVMNNISEGFCRKSDAEFCHFLNISKGSAGEVKNMYYIAEDQRYTDKITAEARRTRCQQLMNSLGGFMKYLSPKKK